MINSQLILPVKKKFSLLPSLILSTTHNWEIADDNKMKEWLILNFQK